MVIFVISLLVFAYTAIWLTCFVHCLVKKEFYPVFGKGLGTRIFWLLTFIFFNPILTLFYIIFGLFGRSSATPSLLRTAVTFVPVLVIVLAMEVPARQNNGPVVRVRDPETGEMVDEKPTRRGVRAHLTVYNSRNGANSTTVRMTSGDPRFSCSHIAIFNQSKKRLLDRVALALMEQLESAPDVEKISYWPLGTTMPVGERVPDVFISLDVQGLKVFRLPLYRSIQGTFLVTAGSQLYNSMHHATESNSPPEIVFSWRGEINHQSRLRGYESRAAKNEQAAGDIAKQISESLVNLFEKYRDEDGPMPDLPAAMSGPYRQPPRLRFLPEDNAQPVVAHYGLTRHCLATWVYEDDRDTTTVLLGVQQQMENAGWNTERIDTRDRFSSHLRMTSGTAQIMAFRIRRPTLFSFMATSRDKPPKRMPIAVHYEERFSEEDRDRAFGELLNGKYSTDALLMFDQFLLRDEYRERFLSALEENPARTPQGYLALAKAYDSLKMNEKARGALMCARALLRAMNDYSEVQKEIEKLAKKIGDEGLLKEPITDGLFREMGFTELSGGSQTVEREVGLNETVLLFYKTDDGIRTFSVSIEESTDKKGRVHYSMRLMNSTEQSRGSSAVSARLMDNVWVANSSESFEGFFFDAEAKMLKGKRFRIRVTVKGQ